MINHNKEISTMLKNKCNLEQKFYDAEDNYKNYIQHCKNRIDQLGFEKFVFATCKKIQNNPENDLEVLFAYSPEEFKGSELHEALIEAVDDFMNDIKFMNRNWSSKIDAVSSPLDEWKFIEKPFGFMVSFKSSELKELFMDKYNDYMKEEMHGSRSNTSENDQSS